MAANGMLSGNGSRHSESSKPQRGHLSGTQIGHLAGMIIGVGNVELSSRHTHSAGFVSPEIEQDDFAAQIG